MNVKIHIYGEGKYSLGIEFDIIDMPFRFNVGDMVSIDELMTNEQIENLCTDDNYYLIDNACSVDYVTIGRDKELGIYQWVFIKQCE